MDLKALADSVRDCPCGQTHEMGIRMLKVGSGLTDQTGELLKEAGFSGRLLVVGDQNTMRASFGLEAALSGFETRYEIYPDLRVATRTEAERIAARAEEADGLLSVGTGSLNDVCRMAAAWKKKPLALFATAPSMDGFASYSAPITDGSFKTTLPAKQPEVILADTKVLAAAPEILKGAGFGDMMAKFLALADWKISHLLTGESFCARTAALTEEALRRICRLADRVTARDEETAGEIMEALVLTGVAMGFTKSPRPASGAEHMLSHFWELKKLEKGELSDFHGRKVGVATLLITRVYEQLRGLEKIRAQKEEIDWAGLRAACGSFADEVEALNRPAITEQVAPEALEKAWPEVRKILDELPSAGELEALMRRAGCAVTSAEIGVSPELEALGMAWHPYIRRRMTLMRLRPMLEV